jgi:biopolymer transport protein ExbB
MNNIILFLLQSTETAVTAATATANEIANTVATEAPKAAAQPTSLLDLLTKGGVIMIPIAVLLIGAIYVFIERFITISKAGKVDDRFMNVVKDHIANGNIQAAKSYCRGFNHPVARVVEKGIDRIGKPIKDIERSMENVAKLEIYKMERWLNILSIIAGIAPMFGFLGTIAGMLKLFDEVASANVLSIGTIAGGINVKMVTSAAGLMVGILAFVFYNSLNAMIDRVVNKIENSSFEFVDLLHEPSH